MNLKIYIRNERKPGEKGRGQCQETATQGESEINLGVAEMKQNLSKQKMNKWRNTLLFLFCHVRVEFH